MDIAEFTRGVLVNLLIILAFVTLCGMMRGWAARQRRPPGPWWTGLLYGLMAVVAMLVPAVTQTGMIFDCRSGVVGTAALIGGPLVALASVPPPLVYRWCLGGAGMVPGLLEVILPAIVGSLCHLWFRRRSVPLTPGRVVLSSLLVTVGTNIPILAAVRVLVPEWSAGLGSFGIVLVILNTGISMALLGSLILLEREHFGAVEALAESERRMRHSQKMAAIGQLAGKVAHSFMNALTGILGNAQLARQKSGDPAVVEQAMADTVETVEKVSKLTGEILAFANPGPLRTRRLDLSVCTAGIRELLAEAIGPNVDVVIDSDRKAGDVNMDPDQIEQVIVHLAVNASEAMVEGGRMTIAVSPAGLSPSEAERLQAGRLSGETHTGDFALLTVRDTGCGMSEQVSSRIFEPFFTTRKEEGNAGLGLSTVYTIVQLHGGFIDVQSRPGHGSTFSVYLPVVSS